VSIVAGATSLRPVEHASEAATLSPIIFYRLPAAAILTVIVLFLVSRQRLGPLRSSTPQIDADQHAIGLHQSPFFWFAASVALMVVVQLAGGLTFNLVSPPQPADALVRGAIGALCVYGWGIIACVAAWLMARPHLPEAVRSLSPVDFVRGVLWLVPLIPIVVVVSDAAVLIYTLAMGHAPAPIAHATLQLIVQEPTRPAAQILMLGAVFGAPIFEETVYRGFLQSAWRRAVGRTGLAMVMAALTFALMHRVGSEPVPWHAIPTILVLGMACGYTFERHGLAAAIGLHAAFNAANLVLGISMT
jgi:membrane protease YdiL (CAAX protease family)